MRGNMRAERARLGMSASELAAVIGVSPNALLSWERGEKEPKVANLIKLSEFFNCSPEYLLGMTDERKAAAKA